MTQHTLEALGRLAGAAGRFPLALAVRTVARAAAPWPQDPVNHHPLERCHCHTIKVCLTDTFKV